MINNKTILGPLDLFEIKSLFSMDTPILANIDLSLLNMGLYIAIVLLIDICYSILSTSPSKISPNRWSLSQETLEKGYSWKDLVFEISNTFFFSGQDKGKGKAKDDSDKDEPSGSPINSNFEDSDEEMYLKDLKRAKYYSLRGDKKGESSRYAINCENEATWKEIRQKRKAIDPSDTKSIIEDTKAKQVKDNSTDIDDLTKYTQDWKIAKDEFEANAKLYNKLKISLNKKGYSNKKEDELLNNYSKNCDMSKNKKLSIEEKLLEYGINPEVQFYSESDKGSIGSYSYGSSSGSDSDSRDRKRVKYSKSDLPLGFIPYNITGIFSAFWVLLKAILRTFSGLLTAILLVITIFFDSINFSITEINLLFIKIDVSFIEKSHLLFIALVVNFFKLMCKGYNIYNTLLTNFFNKDYATIYFNVYFSIIILFILLTGNCDIYIFYC